MSPQTRRKVRGLLILFLLLYVLFTLTPGAVYAVHRLQQQEQETSLSSTSPAPSPQLVQEATPAPGFLDSRSLPGDSTPAPEEDAFTLYDTSTGETFQITSEEFLPAALACEMDLSAPEEALKAQAVALYTFYSYQRAHNTGDGADFACDSSNWLVYVPQSAMEERWGENFSSYYEKLQSIVNSVKGQLLTWQGEPICASFFAISGGSTEPSATVWGQDLPYLQAAASPGDSFADGYLSTLSLTGSQVQEAAEAAWPGETDFSSPEEQWIQLESVTASGYVEQAQVGGRTCTGEELREAFGLRSAWLTLSYQDGTFQFTVRGWGHGVGMSQTGAAFMADQGASYQEILAHYYPGTVLEGAG